MKIQYRNIRLSKPNQARLATVNQIIAEYQKQDLVLTLRQLYYQLVSRDIIPNQQREYDRLGRLLKEGRMAGIVSWDAIEDRLRVPQKPASWESPQEILTAAANQYRVDRMVSQKTYIECWVEKDALSGVLSRVTREYGIALQVNRGYGSVTAMHDCFTRMRQALSNGASKFVILYLGDHDPSGVDMIRDIHDRIFEFWYGSMADIDDDTHASADFVLNNGYGGYGDYYIGGKYIPYDKQDFAQHFEIVPIALTRGQIDDYNPPPNPAKRTDSRAGSYIAAHGSQSWEVDALRPEVLNDILRSAIEDRLDKVVYTGRLALEKNHRAKMQTMIITMDKGGIASSFDDSEEE